MVFRKTCVQFIVRQWKSSYNYFPVIINLIYEKHIHLLMVYQICRCVVTSGMIMGIDTKIKIKNKDLRQICQIIK